MAGFPFVALGEGKGLAAYGGILRFAQNDRRLAQNDRWAASRIFFDFPAISAHFPPFWVDGRVERDFLISVPLGSILG